MAKFIERFLSDENGNATLDWMVLTTGATLLGTAIVGAVT